MTGGGTGADFLHRGPAPRELLKEPPHLWQMLGPDGENLEHRVEAAAQWGWREDERGGGEKERESTQKKGGHCEKSSVLLRKQTDGGGSAHP